jgi:manganese-transporting P-type ATPase
VRKWAEWIDDQSNGASDGSLPLLKPGDASMAAPFTIKSDDVQPVTDILKQGRCTLVTTVQMFKILGLMCLSSAYSFSVLQLAGVKLGDLQVPAFTCLWL